MLSAKQYRVTTKAILAVSGRKDQSTLKTNSRSVIQYSTRMTRTVWPK